MAFLLLGSTKDQEYRPATGSPGTTVWRLQDDIKFMILCWWWCEGVSRLSTRHLLLWLWPSFLWLMRRSSKRTSQRSSPQLPGTHHQLWRNKIHGETHKIKSDNDSRASPMTLEIISFMMVAGAYRLISPSLQQHRSLSWLVSGDAGEEGGSSTSQHKRFMN
jgi:hypothetical protein